MTSKSATNSLGDKPRHGKWTKEEEAYVDLLIEEFRCGALPLREGTTLRSFLSKMINCNPKRVSKKYENTNYNGKHKYEPSTIPMSLEEMKRRRERLQECERRFLAALRRGEEELGMDEDELKAELEESRSAVASNREKMAANDREDKAMAALLEQHKKKTTATSNAIKRASIVSDQGFQDRLTTELQTRMDLANHLSGSSGCSAGSPTADVRDLSLSNTANMTLALPSGFASPRVNDKPQFNARGGNTSLNQLASFDLMNSLQKSGPAFSNPTSLGGMSGHLGELEDDPLGWQVRLQHRASVTNRAQRMLRDRASFTQGNLLSADKAAFTQSALDKSEAFPLPQYLRQSQHQDELLKTMAANEMPFPSLPSSERRSSGLHPAGTMDHLSQLQLASLVARDERRSSGLVSNRILEATRRSSLVELEMMESLKREREMAAMDSLRPFKRLR